EFLLDDALGEYEPRIVMAAAHDVLQLAERVRAGKQRRGEPRASRVEPHRRGPGQDADAMARPDRIPVPDALDIMPHPVAVDQPGAGGLGDPDHAAIDVFGHAGDHVAGSVAEPLRPVLPHQLVIAADAARGHDHGLGAQGELADSATRAAVAARDRIGREDRAFDLIHMAVGDGERIDTVAKAENEAARGGRLARPALERLHDAGAGAPAHMETRDRIAVAHGVIAAAFRPADHRKYPVAHGAQPSAFFTGSERDIGFRPALRPEILVAVEAGRSHPVLQGEIVAVLDAESALLGRINQKQSAERPERLAAEALLAFLIDDDDPLAGVGDFLRRDEAGETGSDHDYICIVSHSSPRFPRRLKPAMFSAVNG